ncbi:MAG: zinc ribbon domain-containing protein [Methanosphaera sp.]|nr:zinc ribbon domain-containing protein [Methanosphaera sp.]
MKFCPQCRYANTDDAMNCTNCGQPLDTKISYHNNYNARNKESNTKYIIISITIILVTLIIAGTVLILANNHTNTPNQEQINTPEQAANTTTPTNNMTTNNEQNKANTPLKIISGSIKTGSSLQDKTYITVNVGKEHAGENVKIRVYYSRNGTQLNPGNIVPKTVDNTGTFSMPSANSFKYYPDHAYITLYDANENIVDAKEVNLNPTSGTQNF